MTGSLTRANALPPPMSPSLASSLAPRQKPLPNAWLVTTLPVLLTCTKQRSPAWPLLPHTLRRRTCSKNMQII